LKQHITPKQALEISEDQFYSLFPEGVVKRTDWANYHHKKINIGKMIEILKFPTIKPISDYHHNWVVILPNTNLFEAKELCDALWVAVKKSL